MGVADRDHYVFVNDDRAPSRGAPGFGAARGDVRIAGRTIDGNFGILAYNFFPDTGDMVDRRARLVLHRHVGRLARACATW